MATISDAEAYNTHIEQMRSTEYPMLKDSLYLDHAGSTLPSATLMSSFHTDMLSHLYGNPHSASPSSQRSTQMIEMVRHDALNLFGADPEVFDLVFTANTTGAVKVVVEALREVEDGSGFWYGYHVESHTSLVGVREAAKKGGRCFEGDEEVDGWFGADGGRGEGEVEEGEVRLFAFPMQSNMHGRKLPLRWIGNCRDRRVFSLLDAAAAAATSPLRLSDLETAPDFTVLSFAKMFGFPDLGALIVKKECAHLFQKRKYFGGGTVDMVVCAKEQWHVMKSASLHEQLEDGTLPFHNILALRSAMQTHTKLFHSLDRIAQHTSALAKQMYETLAALRHANGLSVCRIYKDRGSVYGDASTQGPTIAFNIQDSHGRWVSNTEVEKLATVKQIHLRTGGLCNPGGVAKYLDLAPWEMHENFSAGYRCGGENDVLNGKPTGVIRVSLGAMSTKSDVTAFTDFIEEFFVDKTPQTSTPPSSPLELSVENSRLYIESLAVYPIKSCAGWQIPHDISWTVHREGLAWDREWCIVSQSTGVALSQKAHPRMALIRPHLDFKNGVLRISHAQRPEDVVTVPLSKDPSYYFSTATANSRIGAASVCGDQIEAKIYTSSTIAEFLTKAVGVPCTLARFPPATSSCATSTRHSKDHLRLQGSKTRNTPILLSNESPVLTISRSSLNRLNEIIKAKGTGGGKVGGGGKAAHPSVFRANIILAESPLLPPGQERPYAEDHWVGMTISPSNPSHSSSHSPSSSHSHSSHSRGASAGVDFSFLGPCRRCQMVCIDQSTGEKNSEPFVTLAKTRREVGSGRVVFGVHTALAEGKRRSDEGGGERGTIRVGDVVRTWSSIDGAGDGDCGGSDDAP